MSPFLLPFVYKKTGKSRFFNLMEGIRMIRYEDHHQSRNNDRLHSRSQE